MQGLGVQSKLFGQSKILPVGPGYSLSNNRFINRLFLSSLQRAICFS